MDRLVRTPHAALSAECVHNVKSNARQATLWLEHMQQYKSHY
jgi:hypothetical protein